MAKIKKRFFGLYRKETDDYYKTTYFMGKCIRKRPLKKGEGVLLYNPSSDEAFSAKSFFSPENLKNFKEEYSDLIKGLDFDSIRTIDLTLSRLQEINNHPPFPADLHTDEEKTGLACIFREFQNSIVQITPDCYAYLHYFLPIREFDPNSFIFRCGIPNLKYPERLKGKDIIDAGGYIGDSALILSEYTHKKVRVFEPVKHHVDLIKQTIKLNGKEKEIVLYPYALGDQESSAEIFVQGIASSLVDDQNKKANSTKTTQTETIRIKTLDEIVAKENLKIGLIKTDIEGSEQAFLKGAEKTIKTQKPTLLISIYHNRSDYFHIKPILESWNLDYEFKVVKLAHNTLLIETILIAEIKGKKHAKS